MHSFHSGAEAKTCWNHFPLFATHHIPLISKPCCAVTTAYPGPDSPFSPSPLLPWPGHHPLPAGPLPSFPGQQACLFPTPSRHSTDRPAPLRPLQCPVPLEGRPRGLTMVLWPGGVWFTLLCSSPTLCSLRPSLARHLAGPQLRDFGLCPPLFSEGPGSLASFPLPVRPPLALQ